ncbi:MAG: glycerophosphodiester phosphodiesterase [Promethearchaeota archaeon]
MVKIIAHRGLGKGPFENTIYAIREALGLGVDGIEIDVHRSRDGAIVVFHDFIVDEKTNGTGAVENLSLEELQKLELNGQLKIPTLQEVVEVVKAYPEVLVMVEIKPENIEDSVLNVLCEGNIENQIIISSYHTSVLRRIHEEDEKVQTALIFKKPMADALQIASSIGCSSIAPKIHLISQELVCESRQVGLTVCPWAVNTIEDLRRVIDLGLEVIITDEAKNMQQFLHSLSQR